MDRLSTVQRSKLMSRIKGRGTSPELVVRSIVQGLGFKHCLHLNSLPGSPDIVIKEVATVIFVHGCFWHRHSCPRGKSQPSTRASFWTAKFDQNVRRDRRVVRKLRESGWSVMIIWECKTTFTKRPQLERRLFRNLHSRPRTINP